MVLILRPKLPLVIWEQIRRYGTVTLLYLALGTLFRADISELQRPDRANRDFTVSLRLIRINQSRRLRPFNLIIIAKGRLDHFRIQIDRIIPRLPFLIEYLMISN